MLEGYIGSGTVAWCRWDSGTSAHTAGTESAQGLLANVAPEAVESCEQICSPRRPASPRHLARTENGWVRLQVHQPTQNCSSNLLFTSARSRVIRAGRVREWRTEFIWRSIANHARTVEVTWARMVASASRWTQDSGQWRLAVQMHFRHVQVSSGSDVAVVRMNTTVLLSCHCSEGAD